jgi:hypothetical protein
MATSRSERHPAGLYDEGGPPSLAAARLISVRPCFAGCAPASDLLDIAPRTLLHAGPPLHKKRALSPTLRAAVAAAACRERFAAGAEEALAMIGAGDITLRPAQDFNVVTSLGTVVGPSSVLARVADRDDGALTAFAVGGAEEMPYEAGVEVPLSGVLIERDPEAIASRLAAAARKCVLRAAENIADCTIVTAVGSNGTAVGVQISSLGRLWLSSDDLWARFMYPQLRRADKGILGCGDLLLRCALSRRGEGRLWILDARDRAEGRDNPGGEMVRQIPSGLFTAVLSNIRARHWSTSIPLH